MLHDRQIGARADRRLRTPQGWTPDKTLRVRRRAWITWRRVAAWTVVAALLGVLFQALEGHFEDRYISFVLTVLPLVGAIALVRPESGPRHDPTNSSR